MSKGENGMKQYGEFSGKWVFGSTKIGGPTFYMTAEYPSSDSYFILPVMASPEIGPSEFCVAYKADGGYYLQMGNSMWLTFYEKRGYICLTSDFEEAKVVNFELSVGRTSLQICTKSGFKTVYYTVDNPSPILTVNPSSNALNVFQLTQITPPLKQIRANKGCSKGNFTEVNLTGENLSDLKLNEANFTEADLTKCSFANSDLTKATLISTCLSGVNFENAMLDHANLTACDVRNTDWGKPKSALRLNLSGCKAESAVLGHKGFPLNCSNSILTGGNFYKTKLPEWNLTNSILGGAIFVEANLDGSILDEANAQNTVFRKASIRNASLKNIKAESANFIGANLDNSDLNAGNFSYKKGIFLFKISRSFSETLDTYHYPQESLIKVFDQNGIKLSMDAPIQVIIEGKEWHIGDKAPIYLLELDLSDDKIGVFLQGEGLYMAAVFTGASCAGTRAAGADFNGANLQGVQWHGSDATFDSANLENTDFSNALLVGTNFTKARLSGTNFSNSVLIGAQIRACAINVGHGKQSVTFQQAMLQGANFHQSTLFSALFTNSIISTDSGVKLFKLPASAEVDLTPKNLQKLAPLFQEAGNPINSSATITDIKKWTIDNSKDPDTSAPSCYLVNENLQVFNGENMNYLFTLNDNDQALLEKETVTKQLRAAFNNHDYSVQLGAPIDYKIHWKIDSLPPADFKGAVYYPQMQIEKGIDRLPVYGAPIVCLPNWPQYSKGIAFTTTQINPSQLSSDCIGPSGYPLSFVQNGTIDWKDW